MGFIIFHEQTYMIVINHVHVHRKYKNHTKEWLCTFNALVVVCCFVMLCSYVVACCGVVMCCCVLLRVVCCCGLLILWFEAFRWGCVEFCCVKNIIFKNFLFYSRRACAKLAACGTFAAKQEKQLFFLYVQSQGWI